MQDANNVSGYVEKSCRRLVGDAPEPRRQTLLWD